MIKPAKASHYVPHLVNGANGTKSLADKVQTALISIATTGIVTLCGFAFKTNATLARIEQRQIDDGIRADHQQTGMNNMALDVSGLKVATARIEAKLETKQNLKPR